MQSFLLDLKFAIRQLRKSPAFTATALLMLAFGIGATTAIFSIVEGVLLRPLPFPDAGRLVHVGDHLQGADLGDGAPATAVDIVNYARDTHSFTAIGGYGDTGYELAGIGEPVQVTASRMTPGVFDALQVAPLLGRTFTMQEDQQQERVAVLSYDSWQSRFHGNSNILGTKLLLDRNPYVVIGVMPRSFEFPLEPGHLTRSELWIPMSFRPEEMANQAANWRYNIIGRLKPGVTAAQAQMDVDRVSKEISRTHADVLGGIKIDGVVRSQQDTIVASARPLIRTLFLAVAVVLLIACANLAGLLLVRAIRRQREIALRLALGATSAALLRQMLLESLLLSLAGGVLGIAVANTALRLGKELLPESLPRISEINLNLPVAAFAFGLAIATGFVCGLAPAFAALQTSLNETLKEGGRGSSSGGHGRLRSILVVTEIAIALVLLTASGLLLRSFEKMRQAELGFRPEAITTATYSLPKKQYATQAATDGFTKAVLQRLGQLPGVQAVGLTNVLPGSGNTNENAIVPEGYVPPKGSHLTLNATSLISGDYFRALGTPLLRGRYLNGDDHAGTQLVVVVNHKFASLYWPHQNPVGKRMHVGTAEMQWPGSTSLAK